MKKRENESTNGSFHTANIKRSYKDDTGQWKTTTSFDLKSLPQLSAVAHLALNKLAELDGGETSDEEPEQPVSDDDEIPH